MKELLASLHEINLMSITVRLLMATIFSGVIGMERVSKRRPAGFRTHILVCVGAVLVMMTNQYMVEKLGYSTDASRLGAQVISGIGFLGAGTIIVVGRNQVMGLTTAAGLWACACMGLALGIGFYEGAIMGFIFLVAAMTVLHRFEEYVEVHSLVVAMYVELESMGALSAFMANIKKRQVKIFNLEIEKLKAEGYQAVCVTMTVRLPEERDHAKFLFELNELEGVRYVEELT